MTERSETSAAIERLRKRPVPDHGFAEVDMADVFALVAEVERLRAEREALAMHWRVLRGAQVDMLNGRPDFDAMEEVAGASAEIDDLLTAGPKADNA